MRVASRIPLPAGTLRTSRAAMRAAADRWVAWADRARTDGPLVWAHAASIGEQQSLTPVLDRVILARPELRIVLTHTSPSVVHTAAPAAVCQRDYLPWDQTEDVRRALDALHPSLMVFSRGDLWPALVLEAGARRVPIVVAGAAMRPGSHRRHAMVRRLYGDMHQHISWAGAASEDDARRWLGLGAPTARVVVTGDPRHDAVLERLPSLDPARAIRACAGGDPVVVAGSLEPDDDRAVCEAIPLIPHAFGARWLLVPHEPGSARSDGLRRALAGRGLAAGVWRGPPEPLPAQSVVIVEAFGLLADLYLAADIAYVGGAFRPGRLHSVAEPAAVGRAVLVGPRWGGAPDVSAMIAAGGAVAVPRHGAARVLAEHVTRLAADPAERTRRGLAARATIGEGAAARTAAAILKLL